MRKQISILIYALWFGIAYGLISSSAYVCISYLEPPFSQLALSAVNAHMIWRGPAFTVLLFQIIAIPLLLLFSVRRAIDIERIAFAVFTFVATLGLVVLPARLNKFAAVALACGLTALIQRMVMPRWDTVRIFVLRTSVVLLVVWAVIGAGILSWERMGEQSQIAKLPPAKPGRPNVLLIVLDTLRADHLSAYGYPRATTPNLDSFASQGVLFTNALATSSWTLPSHASLFTGLYPYEHRAGTQALGTGNVTLAETLAQNGYVTAGFVANTFLVHRRTGLARGFHHYEDLLSSWTEAATKTAYGRRIFPRLLPLVGYYDTPSRKRAENINKSFLRWVDSEASQGRPFFAFLNYMDTHDPYLPPAEYASRFSANPKELLARIPVSSESDQPATVRQWMMEVDGYDASLTYLDAQLGRLFEELRSRNVLDNTIVVITSDHGEELMDHGHYGHSTALYRESIHIPLIIRFPSKAPSGLRDRRVVDLTSVAATILDLAGISPTLFAGRSLLPFSAALVHTPREVAGPEDPDSPAMGELDAYLWSLQPRPMKNGTIRSVVTSRWHYIQYPDGRLELFDWVRDPGEQRNLASLIEMKSVTQRLHAWLEKRSTATERTDE